MVATWVAAAFTGVAAAFFGGIFGEVKALQRKITDLGERISRIEGRMDRD